MQQNIVRQGWPALPHWRATRFIMTRLRARRVNMFRKLAGIELTRRPLFRTRHLFYRCW